MKVCSEPGCPELQPESRCITHRRAKERTRGSAARRGYGHEHKALRERWAPLVATGNVKCWRCNEWLNPEQPWDLGHRDGSSEYAGPECWSCNRSTASRR